jgi:hypothetical protein
MPVRPELKGVALMLAGIAFLSVNDALSKYLAERYPIGEVVCLRQIASLAFILPYALATSGIASLRVVDVPGQVWRAIAFIGTAVFIVASLAYLPLAIVTAIAFRARCGLRCSQVRCWARPSRGFAGSRHASASSACS